MLFVLSPGLQLDILEYMHEHEYVHADIKASNLLLSHTDPHQVRRVRQPASRPGP